MKSTTKSAPEKPGWLKLLELQSTRDFGLTLQFLVGALRSPPGAMLMGEEANFREFEKLLLDMRNKMPPGYSVSIGPCSQLHQPVAHISQSPQPTYIGWPAQEQPRFSLDFSPYYIKQEKSIDEAPKIMWDYCKSPILAGNFSFNNGLYRQFSLSELNFIASALS